MPNYSHDTFPCQQSNKENSSSNPAVLEGLNSFVSTQKINLTNDPLNPQYLFEGYLEQPEYVVTCPVCGEKMIINGHRTADLCHTPHNGHCSLRIERPQYECTHCHHTMMLQIGFKADRHLITVQLQNYIEGLLARGSYSLKEIAEQAGVNVKTVKDIDLHRLLDKYTELDENGNRVLKKPDSYCEVLGVDEFLLHHGHRYATIIMDMKTGAVLWVQEGKKKQVIYDFFDYVGEEWMSHVKGVCADMNSDYQEAFEDTYPNIRVIFDRFHIMKNFNDMVMAELRKEEQGRLKSAGLVEEANALKGARHLLCSSLDTLRRKDKEAEEGKVIRHGSELFKSEDIKRKGGYEDRYFDIIFHNDLLYTAAAVKECLQYAYDGNHTEEEMRIIMENIVKVCDGSENKHLMKFGKLITNHMKGITAYAEFHMTSGKVEGTNNKIKTVRRTAYGLPDNTYFFLKIMDFTRAKPRNTKIKTTKIKTTGYKHRKRIRTAA